MKIVEDVCRRGSIREADVLSLQRVLDRGGPATVADAEALFKVHANCRVQDATWSRFFIETVSDVIVREVEPSGYLTSLQASWLVSRLAGASGLVESTPCLELLLCVLEKARWSPVSLVRFALAQVLASVETGAGPLRAGNIYEPGHVEREEVAFIRAAMLAFEREGHVPVTRVEIELLLAINETLLQPAGAAWGDLYLRAVADAVLVASGYVAASRKMVLAAAPQIEAAFDDQGLVADMALAEPMRHIFARYRELGAEQTSLARLERQRIEIITGEPLALADGTWLAVRLGQAVATGVAEHPILAALAAAGARLHPALAQLAEQAAAAA